MLNINQLNENQLGAIRDAINKNDLDAIARIIDTRCSTCPTNYNNIKTWVMENKIKLNNGK